MKRMISRIALCTLFALPALSMAAGDAPDNSANEIQLSTDKITFTGQGGRQTVKILKGKNYELFYKSDWMTCKELKDGTLEISASPYSFFYPRTASVVLTSKKTNYSRVISVSQVERGGRPAVMEKPTGSNLLFLSDMDLSKSTFFFIKNIHKNRSVDGGAVSLKGSAYSNGIGTHAPSTMIFKVGGAKRFIADVGIDDEVIMKQNVDGFGIADYNVLLDGKSVKQGRLKLNDNAPVALDIDLAGAKILTLQFDAGTSTYGDHISLGNARFVVDGSRPVNISEAEARALTRCNADADCGRNVAAGCGSHAGCKEKASCNGCKSQCSDCKSAKASCAASQKPCHRAAACHKVAGKGKSKAKARTAKNKKKGKRTGK